MIKEYWLQLKVTMDALATDKKVSLLFESLKPGIDFSSPTMNTFGGILSQYKAVSSTKKKKNLLLCVATFISCLSLIFWITCYKFYISTCCFTL